MISYRELLDSNYAYSSEKIKTLTLEYHKKRNYSLLFGISRYFHHFIKSVPTFFCVFNLFRVSQKVGIAIIDSKNQYLATLPIIDNSDIKILGISVEFKQKGVLRFPIFFPYLLSLIFFPVIIFFYFKSKGYVRESFKYAFCEYCLIYGYRLFNNMWLSLFHPKFLLIANDHRFVQRDLVKSCKRKGIKTIYFQHASITESFPPLITDYAFLEGQDSWNKYTKIGDHSTIVKLIGIPKFDRYYREIKPIKYIKRIGVCTNEFDSLSICNEILNELKSEYEVIVRPHPNDPLFLEWERLSNKHNVLFSNSKIIGVLDFLKDIDAIIAYNCNIILEATIFNIPAFSYQLSDEYFDHYGFVNSELINHYVDIHSLRSAIKASEELGNIRMKAKYYCGTIGTPYDGRSLDLFKEYLKEL